MGATVTDISGFPLTRGLLDASSGIKEYFGTLTWAHGGAGEGMLARIDTRLVRYITAVHRNEDPGAVAVTMRVYLSNDPVIHTVLANMQQAADEISGGLITAAGTPNAIFEALSAANGADYTSLCAKYRFIYFTADATGATAGINQFLDILCTT